MERLLEELSSPHRARMYIEPPDWAFVPSSLTKSFVPKLVISILGLALNNAASVADIDNATMQANYL